MEAIEIIVIVASVVFVFAVFSSWLKKKLKHKGECCSDCKSCDGICKEKINEALDNVRKEISLKK